MSYVHLRIHTEYSIVDGSLRVDDAVAAACSDGQGALAITDLNNLFAGVRFYKAARDAGVKPILGCDVRIAAPEGASQDAPTALLLLVTSRQGYLNLCELLSRAWLQGQRAGQAQMQWSWLADEGLHEGLIALCGARQGAVGRALLAGDEARARLLAQQHRELFGDRFYLEVQRSGHAECARHVAAAARLAAELDIPLVATHPVQFLAQADFEAHEARVCIAEGETLGNPRRQRHFTPEQYFKTGAQMAELFADLPSALRNSVEIARRCNLSLVLGKPQLPHFPTPDGQPLAEFFRAESYAGLERRLEALYPDAARRDKERPRYVERLEFELATIAKMGFEGYFLIVADFINWAKDNGCPVGPGRGSGAGSLVAYSLRITDLDPLAYKLLFERFLNPERVSMPDFDIDFCQENRDRVIDYVKQKYGVDAVSQIATFGTLAARAALRDAGRVQELGYNFCDQLAKLIPNKPGQHVTIEQAIGMEPQLKERMDQEEVRQLLGLAQQLEGLPRNIGMHAGGVLIAPGKLTDFCPLYAQPGSTDAVSQYDKDDVEAIGLVKFDFLGLATLTILDLAVRNIRRNHPEMAGLRMEDIPLDDPASYKLMARGDTVAVFQLESRGMQGMLRDARPDRFEDIIALVALYRPGPMDLIPSYCQRKAGTEAIEYPDPRMAPVLEETYGIMVYQEQVMQVAQVIGGYSLGGADLLRRAMGKKKAEEMAKHRGIFAEGAAKNGIPPEKANEIFDLMEKFAGYGFNKSHAAAYALLAVQTAWLKAHYPAEFMAANMSIALDDTDKLKVLVDDARAMGLHILLPDVNEGQWRFDAVDARTIRYALGAIKGTGRAAIEAIVEAREAGGPFKSLMDFAERVDRARINRRVLEALIRGGAFDALDPNRATLMAAVGMALEHAAQRAEHADQGGLFDMLAEEHAAAPEPPQQPPWDLRQRLSEEKLAIGFVLSGHLFDAHADEVRRFASRPLAELTESRDSVLVAGIVAGVRVVQGQRGRVAIVTLEDRSGVLETVVNERVLDTVRALLREDELLVFQGRAMADRFSGGIRFNVDAVWTLEQARERLGRRIRMRVNGMGDASSLIELARSHAPQEGGDGLPLELELERGGARATLRVDRLRLRPGDDTLAALGQLALQGQVQVVYDGGEAQQPPSWH